MPIGLSSVLLANTCPGDNYHHKGRRHPHTRAAENKLLSTVTLSGALAKGLKCRSARAAGAGMFTSQVLSGFAQLDPLSFAFVRGGLLGWLLNVPALSSSSSSSVFHLYL